jgi:hypothetical protein
MSRLNAIRLSAEHLEAREVPAAGLDDVFNAARYLQLNPDVAAAGVNAEDHFRRNGQREGRDPGGLFDTRVYLDDNPDVRDVVERGVTTAVGHFLSFGQFEGRNPSRTFDAATYLAANPDVAAVLRTGAITAYQHFVENGQFEDRAPGRGFDARVYLDDNPDVRDAVQRGQIRSGTSHFIEHGRFEGRSKPITPAGTLPPTQTNTTFDGTSANNGDKKYYSFSVSTTRPVRVTLTRVGGDFAKLEIENQATSVKVLELEPAEGPNIGTVTLAGGTNYLLRVRAANDAPAQFRVTLTQL